MRLLDLRVQVDQRRKMFVEQFGRPAADVFGQRVPGLMPGLSLHRKAVGQEAGPRFDRSRRRATFVTGDFLYR
jgi:hypothetical protein